MRLKFKFSGVIGEVRKGDIVSILEFCGGCRGGFNGDEGYVFVVFGEGVSVVVTIMHYFTIKQPRSSQKNMTSINR